MQPRGDTVTWPESVPSRGRRGHNMHLVYTHSCGLFYITPLNPYTNTNKEKFGSFFSRALAYEVNGFPR